MRYWDKIRGVQSLGWKCKITARHDSGSDTSVKTIKSKKKKKERKRVKKEK